MKDRFIGGLIGFLGWGAISELPIMGLYFFGCLSLWVVLFHDDQVTSRLIGWVCGVFGVSVLATAIWRTFGFMPDFLRVATWGFVVFVLYNAYKTDLQDHFDSVRGTADKIES